MASNSTAFNSTAFSTITSTYYLYWKEFVWTSNVLVPSWPVIILFGILANLTNISVFLKTGVKDNVTTLLLSLSVSDLLYLVLISPTACTFIILRFARDWHWPFHYQIGVDLLYWPAITCYDCSAFLSVWLGITRCACVAMPLRFKSVFTKARTVKIVIASFLLAVSLRIPIISIYRVVWRTNPNTNSSYAYIAKPNREAMTRVNDILNRNSILYINFIIMITCVSVLSFQLLRASRVRRSFTSASAAQQESAKPDNQGLSTRDLHVLQSVVVVCSIFIMSQAPFLMYSTARLINQELDIGTRYQFLFSMFTITSLTCSNLNASVNIFVYYRYNSKYRAQINSMFKTRETSLKTN
ncbi:chemosensory receptor b [Plakobranchus ocellatus]|uniref:Chemosensory receptor b n=1 Tax=Plakobranchus ocellatus TaxID=259542 RepID=A0AAV4CIH4_9GAST|nr:chemosensory receptor b [Plakobranchus ocellatus]